MKRSLLSLTFAMVAASVAGAQNGVWASKTPSTAGCSQGAVASDGTYLYVFGGAGAPPYTLHQRYDPLNNVWTPRAAMQQGNTVNAGACYNGFVYSFGRWDTAYTGTIERFDIAANTWTTLPGVTIANLVGSAASTLGNRIYITGGFVAPGTATNIATEFDPVANTARQLAPMPAAFGYHASAAVASVNRLYVMGGTPTIFGNDAPGLSTLYEYDPVNNVWAARTAMNIAGAAAGRESLAAFSLANKVYAVGGRTGTTVFNTLLEYTPGTNAWVQRTNLPTARHIHMAATVGFRGYLYGGATTNAGAAVGTVDEYTAPSTGLAPSAATGVTQTGLLGVMNQGGWTGNFVSFSGTVTDTDVVNGLPQQVQLEVQVKPAAAAWSAAVTIVSPLTNQGTACRVDYTIPLSGPYDWRYHSVDSFGNVTPSAGGIPGWTEYNNNAVSPDFSSDQVPPTIPTGRTPVGVDARVLSARGGPVTFTWNPSTDNSGQPVTYDVEVLSNLTGGTVLGGAVGLTSTTVDIPLIPSNSARYWRVRAKDFAGTPSTWSPIYIFRVVFEDTIDNSAGDARKACGMSVAGSMRMGIALIVLAMVGLSMRRRSH